MSWISGVKLGILGVMLLVPVLALAESRAYPIVVGPPTVDDLQLARQLVPSTGPTSGLAQSRIIYLNRTGVTLQPGSTDARTNHSTLATRPTVIPPWIASPATWTATVACMRELFAPFDVTVVDVDPGNVPHVEAVFGGTPTLLGMKATILGVAPFTSDCSIIENAMVFTFTNNIPDDARLACETQAQEVAHAFGLDHELLPSDPLTYLSFDGNRSFQNQIADCGEDRARACGIDGSTCRGRQNSVATLFERLGPKAVPGDFTPPTVAITSPAPGAAVRPGFEVTATANDNTRITIASIYIDGVPSGSTSTPPWTIRTPASVPAGPHTIKFEVTDGRNTKASEIEVTISGDAEVDDYQGGCASTRGSGLVLAAALAGLLRRRATKRA